MRAMRSGIAAVALAAFVTGLAARPAAAQAADRLYPIAGMVTNSSTGETVAQATVTLYGQQSHELVQTAETDADGRFALAPVPAGKYDLSVSRRGYLTGRFNQHQGYSSAIVTGEGQDTEHIPFHLDPGAVVRGTVTDDAGEPVTNASVLLVRKVNDLGLGEHLQTTSMGMVDDRGQFEQWNVQPGTYLLAVKAEPWFAIHPSQSQLQKAVDDEDRAAMTALDVVYPVTFFDGATEESVATPIEVKSGDRIEANVSLHAVPALHLTMQIPAAAGSRGAWNGAFLRQSVLGNTNFGNFGGMMPAMPVPGSPGTVEFAGVAPGHYTLTETNPPGRMELDASGNQEIDSSTAAAMSSVDFRVRMADGSPLPQALSLSFFNGNITDRRMLQIPAKGEAHLDAVPQGQWNITANAGSLMLGVVSIQSSIQSGTESSIGPPLADERITVKDRPLTLTVTLAPAKTNVEGFAAKDGRNEAGVMIVLAPKNPEAHLSEFRRDQTDSDGSFSLQNVVPGAYTVVAIEDGWDLDWAEPEVIGRYLKAGTSVSVPASSPAQVKLSAPVPVQQK
jgi:5-hydroxyisourate hydrolase-like protein (transthyretin family)